ncbi:hypothetical protein HYDPIDRAFT_179583 [Hydnomerulius pinastri MD-312]|nr:hypothetical protein HYDPIDRAFT_179583 [Hydnomerulius pinastri MD-312]
MRLWNPSVRYTPLLPASPDARHPAKQALTNRRFCCNILIISTIIATILVVGALRIFDLELSFASTPPDASSSELPVEDSSIPSIPPNDPAVQPTKPADIPSSIPPVAHEPTLDYAKEHLSMDEIRAMVSQTKGFYARDYSLGLGWNNVRYIIEASVLQARLLNRTLVLPSFVYARTCAYDISVCADQAHMVNKGDAIGWGDWRDLPIEQQMGWQIPITMMLNITQLRRFQPVVTTSDYLQYAGLPVTLETSSGYWDRSGYHQSPDPFGIYGDASPTKPSLFVIENAWYDPEGVIRVDELSEGMKQRGGWTTGNASVVQSGSWQSREKGKAQVLLESLLPSDKHIVEWEEARSAVKELASQMPQAISGSMKNPPDFDNDDFVEEVLNLNGWEVLQTFQGAGGMDFVKHVTLPIKQVALRTNIRGFVEDYSQIDAEVVVLAGETHLYRKPGQMRFTSQSAQQLFQRLVLHHVVPLDKVYDLARKLDLRISAMNNGRQWMSSHVRRGDFVSAGWAWGNSHEGHLERVKQHLEEGRKLLQQERPYIMYSIPDVTPDTSLPHREPPQEGDRFFIATDESDPEKLQYFSNNGAIMFRELMTFEDRHEFGWGILFADIIGLVEQATLARASYFYGSAMSSFTGGVFNMRAVLGAEQITALAD